jgi:hypothetical protein
MAQRVHRVAARGVEGDGHALARAFLVKRPEIAMRDVAAAVIGVDHDADRAETRDGALHLLDRRPHIDVQRHEGDALEALAIGPAPVIEPVVVGSAQGDRVIALAHARQKQPAGRIDDLQIDALAVIVGEVLLRRRRPLAGEPAVLRAVEIVARIDRRPLPVLLRQALAVDPLVIDGVSVGVDDDHAVLHRAILRGCARASREHNPGRPVRQRAPGRDSDPEFVFVCVTF